MASEIDPTVIQENRKVSKVAVREQFEIAANEITALQNITSPARKMAYSDVDFDSL